MIPFEFIMHVVWTHLMIFTIAKNGQKGGTCLSLHMLIMFWRYKVCVHDASDDKNIVLGL
jgi:hypothetical protein